MDPLFRRALVIADLHFGRSGNALQASQDNLAFLTWAIDEAKTWGADSCIMLGDWFDNRSSIGVATMHHALNGLEMLSTAFPRSWFITGNHDQFYRDRRDITSIAFAKHMPNITLVNDPLTVGEVTFLPWLLPDEHTTLTIDSRYVFAHLEVAGFLRNAKSIVPETEHSITAKHFPAQDTVFTGHFHMRQAARNICYTGNIMPFDFRDDGDSDRGIMLLEWGREPVFRAWPGQPLYRSIKLTELLNDPAVLRPNMTVRVAIDMPLSYEEAQEMREALVSGYGLRKLELAHSRDQVDQANETETEVQTVDEIVLQGLANIESVELSPAHLIEIYQSLAD